MITHTYGEACKRDMYLGQEAMFLQLRLSFVKRTIFCVTTIVRGRHMHTHGDVKTCPSQPNLTPHHSEGRPTPCAKDGRKHSQDRDRVYTTRQFMPLGNLLDDMAKNI